MAIRKPTEWTIEEARRHLHALIGEAEQAGPQPVEKDDSQEVMIVPIWKWRSGGNLADFFLNSPLRNSGINLEPLPFTVEDFDEWMRKRGTFDDLERLADALVTQAEEPQLRYLLDTNIVSEFRLPTPATQVIAFIGAVDPASAFLSVVTVMEVHRGVAALPVGKRRSEIEQWLVNDLLPEFDGRILDIDQSTARICGYLLGQRKLESTIRRSMDFWLAATALQYDLAIVTRNERDFRDLGVEVVNPWVS